MYLHDVEVMIHKNTHKKRYNTQKSLRECAMYLHDAEAMLAIKDVELSAVVISHVITCYIKSL